MTSTIWAFSNKNTDYKLIKENRSIKPGYNIDDSNTSNAKDELTNIFSDQEKIFIRVPTGYYHCVHDMAGLVFHLNDINDNIIFMFDTSEIKLNLLSKKASDFCFKLFDYYNIKYELIDLSNIKEFNTNNFYARGSKALDYNGAKIVYDKSMHLIKDTNIKPYKKVYLSRKNIHTDNRKPSDINVFNNFSRKTFSRIDDEVAIENFFKSKGFEIVCPEDFNSLEDQINFMYETKTLASITGAGFANEIFMQPGGTVIEITTPLITQSFDQENKVKHYLESQHHHYTGLSLKKEHLHIGIPNISGIAEELINNIKNNKIIIGIIENE